MGNLAALYWTAASLREAWQLWSTRARRRSGTASRISPAGSAASSSTEAYEFGRWDEAMARADAFLREVEAGSPHYLSGQVYVVRAMLRLGRGDAGGAASDVENALELARRAGDPQIVHQTNALRRARLLEVGQNERALPLADEFLAAIQAGHSATLGSASRSCSPGRLPQRAEARRLRRLWSSGPVSPGPSPATAYARGDYVAAAEQCAGMGAVAQEAYCATRGRPGRRSRSARAGARVLPVGRRNGTCARASRSSPRRPSSRSAGTRPCGRRVAASRGFRR